MLIMLKQGVGVPYTPVFILMCFLRKLLKDKHEEQGKVLFMFGSTSTSGIILGLVSILYFSELSKHFLLRSRSSSHLEPVSLREETRERARGSELGGT